MKKLQLIAILALATTPVLARRLIPVTFPAVLPAGIFPLATGGGFTTLSDVSNNNNDGTATNVVSVNGFRNFPQRAGHFDGMSSKVVVPNNLILNPQQISIVALIRPLGFYSGNCQGNNIIYKSFSYYTPGCWGLGYDDQNYDLNCGTYTPNFEQMEFYGSGASSTSTPAGYYLSPNNWYFMVATYDGSVLRRYQTLMDTMVHLASLTPISTQMMPYTLGSNSSNVIIGATQNGPYPFWVNGDIDEIALFNRAVSDTEVTAIYNFLWQSGLSVKDQNPLEQISVSSANGKLQISNSSAAKDLQVTLFDLMGRKLLHDQVQSTTSSYDLSAFSKGMMVLELEADGQRTVKKIMNF